MQCSAVVEAGKFVRFESCCTVIQRQHHVLQATVPSLLMGMRCCSGGASQCCRWVRQQGGDLSAFKALELLVQNAL